MYSIGDLAREAGIKVQTVRYYEQIGILPEGERTSGNQRRYDEAARRRLNFIRHARELGFPLDAIRELLALADQPDTPCDRADAIARRQLDAVDRRIARLVSLRAELSRMIDDCSAGPIAECRIIETLGDHSLCLTDHSAGANGESAPL
ncbi:MerR family transcriptional regulator [Acuticoccus sediminis]|uniref:MerR family transcriptional regulator n=1 Tax=Acuticoccus sediminis TaxID=2184697 RepID=A0A8B2P347_9HYPH|nr:helix-turn-helix domain-containing protein [Acuticoccus sediminis]RAI04576.1 MerR family transcriptional regulator [Acuticoccus sediminis]